MTTENRSLLDILTELRDLGLEAVANAAADHGRRLSPQLLLEVTSLVERVDDLQLKRTPTICNVGGLSPQAVTQRIEEAERRASKANPPTPPSPPVDDASFELADGRDDHRQDRGEVPVSVTSALLARLYQSLVQRGGDGHVGGEHIGEGSTELFRGGRGSGSVAEVAHDSSPSSGCGESTVGDAGPVGGGIDPSAGRDLLARFLAHFDVKIRAAVDVPYFPADSGVCEALGITDAEYSTAVMDLSAAGAADCGTGTASSMIDALAFSAGGAR